MNEVDEMTQLNKINGEIRETIVDVRCFRSLDGRSQFLRLMFRSSSSLAAESLLYAERQFQLAVVSCMGASSDSSITESRSPVLTNAEAGDYPPRCKLSWSRPIQYEGLAP